jgi:hypothetical protein
MLQQTAVQVFGHAERVAAAERRAQVRYCFARPPLIHFLECPGHRNGAALVHDLSIHGLGLVVAYRFPPGTVLLVQLWGRRPGTLRTLLAQVVHATPQPDGTWLTGCRFTPPLSDGEMAMAVRQDR